MEERKSMPTITEENPKAKEFWEKRESDPLHPFEEQRSLEMAIWLILHGVSQRGINDYLKLNSDLQYHNFKELSALLQQVPHTASFLYIRSKILKET